MQTFSLKHRPANLISARKKTITRMAFVVEPFIVETQEGPMHISPETVDDWDNGYWVAYPADGSKPYSIAPKFVTDNYVPVQE